MALDFFKKDKAPNAKKNCLAIPENMYNAPFEDIIACMDPQYIKDAVIFDFAKICPYRKPSEYRYFRMFPEWESLFSEHLEDIMYDFEHVEDFHTIVQLFPEHAPEIYEFLLKDWLSGPTASNTWMIKEIRVVDDILIPMSDLERYQYCKFDIVRDRCIEILDVCVDYTELWDILQVFEQYFDIPRERFTEYLSQELSDFVDCYNREKIRQNPFDFHNVLSFDFDDYNDLLDFFQDREAFELFMNNLPKLLENSGLELYTLLIKVLGPMKEIVNLHDTCAEFLTEK